MRSLRTLIALLLALVWLPATLHCGLDAVGVFAHADNCCADASDAGPHEKSSCGLDGCDVVESGGYPVASGAVKVPAPIWDSAEFSLIVLVPVLASETEITVFEAVESPPEIKRTWHIVSRAARLPGAPSLIAA